MRRLLGGIVAAVVAVLAQPGGAASASTPAGAASASTPAQPATASTPGPPDAPEYWFDNWHLKSLWAAGVLGQGVTIAEIDTGVNAALPELQGRVLGGTDLGRPGDGRTDREIDPFGHGTAMASIMVARPGTLNITGMAPGAKILPIAVPLDGTTNQGRPDNLPKAIRYAADHGAKIISMSLGGKRTPSTDSEPCPDDEQAAVYHALRKGSVVIASVGNTGPTTNTVEEPGVCLGVVSVGSVDVTGAVASFSARQPYLTLVAPGVGVPSLGRVRGQAYAGRGTSQSTAIASAALALVWSRYPKLTGKQLVTRVLATLDAHRDTPSKAYGYGSLDTYRAVTAKVPAGSPNPVYAAVAPFLARDAALSKGGLGPAPSPAPKRGSSTGSYSVGATPRLTPQVLTGLALAAVGLLLLVVLLAAGVLGRTRRRPAHAAAPRELPGPPEPAGLPEIARPPDPPRPRPGPG